MGVSDLGERNHAIDYRADGASRDEGHHVAHERRGGGGLFVDRADAQHGAAHGEAFAKQDVERERHLRAGEQSHENEPAARGERADRRCRVRSAEQIHRDLDAGATGPREHGFRDGGNVGADHEPGLDAECAGAFELVRRAGRPEGVGSDRARELRAGRADAASHRGDEHVVARRHAALRHQCVVRSDERLGDRGRVGERERPRKVREVHGGHAHILGVRPAVGEAEDAVTDAPRDDSVAESRHFAGVLDATDVGRCTGRGRVTAHPLQRVRAIERGGMHADHDIAGAGLRLRHIADLEDGRVTRAGDHGRAHGRHDYLPRVGLRRSEPGSASSSGLRSRARSSVVTKVIPSRVTTSRWLTP